MTSLRKFYDMLSAHDWYYGFSDDHSVYMKGEHKMAEFKCIAEESIAHQSLLDQWKGHIFSGPHWGTDRQPKPKRPKED